MSAEPFDLEPEAIEHSRLRLERVAFGGREMQRHRKQQPLRRGLAALEHAHELLVQHALVRRVLIDEHDAVVVLEQQVRATELEQRRHVLRRRGLRRGRRGEARLRGTPRLAFARGVRFVLDADRPAELLGSAALEQAVGGRVRRPQQLDVGACGAAMRDAVGSPGPHDRAPRCVEGAERAAHGVLHGPLDRPPIAEPHLGLRRMHVHIDRIRGEDDVEEQRRTHSRGESSTDTRLPPRARSPASRIGAAVHGQEGAAARGADIRRSLDEPADVDRAAHVVDLDQPVGDGRSPQRRDTVAQRVRGRQRERLMPVVRDGEADVAPRERDHRRSRRHARHSDRAPRKNLWRAGAL